MSTPATTKTSSLIYFIAVIGALAIMGLTVKLVSDRTAPEPLDSARATERADALQTLTETETSKLAAYSQKDADRGVFTLPIDVAMDLVIREWRDPEAGKQKLVELSELATKELPKEPEPPSDFE